MNDVKSSLNTVFIGMGANIGPVRENFARATSGISKISNVKAVSSLYESAPVGLLEQPRFVNAVLKAETDLSPSDLLDSLKAIEKYMGRKKTVKWGPRIIDLDIIFYGNLIMATDSLVIPHPRAHERKFVLKPLLEIEPFATHPAIGMSVKEICSGLKDSQTVSKIGGPPVFR